MAPCIFAKFNILPTDTPTTAIFWHSFMLISFTM